MADDMKKFTAADIAGSSDNAKSGYEFQDPNQWNKHKAVDYKKVNKYTFMTESFEGTGGFYDGSYIIPYGREMFYDERKIFSVYSNYVRPMVRSTYEPVFNEEPKREITKNGVEQTELIVNNFVDDVNGAGMSMTDFTKNVTGLTNLHSVTFAVVDNFSDDELAESQRTKEIKDLRLYPYAYSKAADQVLVSDIVVDKFGNLLQISFTDDPDLSDKNNKARWLRWNDEYSVLIKKNKPKNGTSVDCEVEYVEAGERVYHRLGFMPVKGFYSSLRTDPKVVLTKPNMYEIALLNVDIYNRDSEIRDHERSQAFGIFYIQAHKIGNIEVGLHNVLGIPIDAKFAPGFASPDTKILEGLVNNRTKAKENLYQIAEQNGVSGIVSESGVAKSYDFFASETILKNSANIAESVEEFLIKCEKAYTREEYDYVVEYEKDFKPGSQEMRIASFEKIVDMGAPSSVLAKMWKEVFDILFPLAEEDERAIVFAAIDKAVTDEMNSEPPIDSGAGDGE